MADPHDAWSSVKIQGIVIACQGARNRCPANTGWASGITSTLYMLYTVCQLLSALDHVFAMEFDDI